MNVDSIKKSIIEGVTRTTINKAHRLRGLKRFNGCQENNGKIIYYNFKMICGSGEAQSRTLREFYHVAPLKKDVLPKNQTPTYYLSTFSMVMKILRKEGVFINYKPNKYLLIAFLNSF